MTNINRKIVVIDDDEGILEAFHALLESEGYDVTASPDDDILFSMNPLPDLIILDILLSGKDGREICKKLKRNQMTRNIPIIMTSAHPKTEISATECGADDFLKKPFEMNELLAKVTYSLQRKNYAKDY